MVTPYKGYAAESPENTFFNKKLSKARVKNEHSIGVLKNRWASLKQLRIHINEVKDTTLVCRWIAACTVLNNMMAIFSDSWEELQEDEEEDEDTKEVEATAVDEETLLETMEREALEIMEQVETDEREGREGALFREVVKHKLLEIFEWEPPVED
jgi:DDE superfamily endonuclease